MKLKQLHWAGVNLLVRPGTSDFKAFKEVIVRHGYSKGFAGSEVRFEIMPGEQWLDLGANIGSFAVWAGQRGARVSAYEPEDSCFAMLEANILLNRLDNITAVKAAVVGNGESEMQLYVGEPGSEWRSSLYKFKSPIVQKVKCLQVADVLAAGNFDGVKMDIEGAELDILANLKSWGSVKKLVFEYHFDVNNSMEVFYRNIEQLRRHFDFVRHAKFPADLKYYDFFPPATKVYCLKK